MTVFYMLNALYLPNYVKIKCIRGMYFVLIENSGSREISSIIKTVKALLEVFNKAPGCTYLHFIIQG